MEGISYLTSTHHRVKELEYQQILTKTDTKRITYLKLSSDLGITIIYQMNSTKL